MPILPQDHNLAGDAAASLTATSEAATSKAAASSRQAPPGSTTTPAADPHYKPERAANIEALNQIRKDAGPYVLPCRRLSCPA